MADNQLHTHYQDCLGPECAWWNQDKQECVVLGYQRACDDLANTMAEIRMKLTPELFRIG